MSGSDERRFVFYGEEEMDTKEEFSRLNALLYRETCHESRLGKVAQNQHYRAIIALGPDVIPILIKDMIRNSGHWHAALAEITGQDPVRPECAGNAHKMGRDWKRWFNKMNSTN